MRTKIGATVALFVIGAVAALGVAPAFANDAPVEEITTEFVLVDESIVEETPVEEVEAAPEETPAVESRTTDVDFVTVAWIATKGDIWNPAQVLAYTVETDEPDLNALDEAVATHECGVYFQIDVYTDDEVTDALIAGGVLYGPSNPDENLIPGGEGTAWKFIESAPCPDEANPAGEIIAACGTANVTVSNLLGDAESRLTASFVVYVEGQFSEALVAFGGETVVGTPIIFGEDSGDHLVTLRTGPAFGDLLLGEVTVGTDCKAPETKVDEGEWQDEEYGCPAIVGDPLPTTVATFRVITTTTYERIDGVDVPTVTETRETGEPRVLSEEEVKALNCPVPTSSSTSTLSKAGTDSVLLMIVGLALFVGGIAGVALRKFGFRLTRSNI